MSTEPPSPIRLFIFSHPRTTSNLFMRLFSQHPDIAQEDYPFMWAFMHGPDRIMIAPEGMSENLKLKLREQYKDHTFQGQSDKLQEFIAKCENEGKIPMIKEHSLHTINPQFDMFSEERRAIPKPSIIDNKLDIPDHNGVNVAANGGSSALGFENPTIMSERMLRTLAPAFIIRHPARVVPSYLRATRAMSNDITDKHFRTVSSYAWSRLVFDYYREMYATGADHVKDPVQENGLHVNGSQESGHHGNGSSQLNGRAMGAQNGKDVAGRRYSNWPLVIDADDLINDTKEIIQKFCKIAGLDESNVKYEWEPKNDKLSAVHKAFLGTINGSTGVIRKEQRLETPSIPEEAKAWIEEFGEEVAKQMVDVAENMMEDYEYLKQYRL